MSHASKADLYLIKVVNSNVYKVDPVTGQQYVVLDEGPMRPDAWYNAFYRILDTVKARDLQGKAVVQHAWGRSISEILTVSNNAHSPDSKLGGLLRFIFCCRSVC